MSVAEGHDWVRRMCQANARFPITCPGSRSAWMCHRRLLTICSRQGQDRLPVGRAAGIVFLVFVRRYPGRERVMRARRAKGRVVLSVRKERHAYSEERTDKHVLPMVSVVHRSGDCDERRSRKRRQGYPSFCLYRRLEMSDEHRYLA